MRVSSEPSTHANWRRGLLNAWIALLLCLLSIDAFPSGIEGQRRLKALVNPLLKAAGLWQGSWALFAPNPDRTNTWVEADVEFADGSHRFWSTPDWQALVWRDRMFLGRHVKLSNNLRLDRYRRAWPELARYAVRSVRLRESDPAVVYVKLTRHWWNVPPPEQYAHEFAQYGQVPPPRTQYPKSFVFYQRGWP